MFVARKSEKKSRLPIGNLLFLGSGRLLFFKPIP
jgi:hypothetical protein